MRQTGRGGRKWFRWDKENYKDGAMKLTVIIRFKNKKIIQTCKMNRFEIKLKNQL